MQTLDFKSFKSLTELESINLFQPILSSTKTATASASSEFFIADPDQIKWILSTESTVSTVSAVYALFKKHSTISSVQYNNYSTVQYSTVQYNLLCTAQYHIAE